MAGTLNDDGKNHVMSRAFASTETVIDKFMIGTGSTAPTSTDLFLEEPVLGWTASTGGDTVEDFVAGFPTFDLVNFRATVRGFVSSVVANGNLLQEVNTGNLTEQVFDRLDATTGWAVAGGATNLTLDTTTFKEGTASLNFDMDGVTAVGTLSKTITSKDISSDKAVYWYADVPDTTNNFTKFAVFLANEPGITNFNRFDFLAAGLVNGFNVLRCDLSSPDATGGTFDNTAVTDIRLEVTQSVATAETDFRADMITSIGGNQTARFTHTSISKSNTDEVAYIITYRIP